MEAADMNALNGNPKDAVVGKATDCKANSGDSEVGEAYATSPVLDRADTNAGRSLTDDIFMVGELLR